MISAQETPKSINYDVLLDNQAEHSIFGNGELLSEIKTLDPPKRYRGIGKDGVFVSKSGKFLDLAVDYHPGIGVNVLSWSQIKNDTNWKCGYSEKEDLFWLKTGTSEFNFKRIGGLYRHTVKNHLYITLREAESNYTKREVVKMREAREIQRRLGFPAASGMVQLLRSGAINNFPITPHDVVRAESAYGPSIPYLKGKTTTENLVVTPSAPLPRTISSAIHLHMDLMFVDGLSFLISVGVPIGLTIVTALGRGKGAKSEGSIVNAVKEQLGMYYRRHFHILNVASDSEINIGAALAKVRGPPWTPRAPGKHDGYVESKIRRVKETARAIQQSLPYALGPVLQTWCILYSTYVINLLPSKTGYEALSPREAFTGIKPDFSRDLRVGFGDYAQVSARDMDNSMKERTVGAIAVLPTGNLSGAVKFLSLPTGKVISRDSFRILPIPKEYIDIIEQWQEGSLQTHDKETHTSGEEHSALREVSDRRALIDLYESGNRRAVEPIDEEPNTADVDVRVDNDVAETAQEEGMDEHGVDIDPPEMQGTSGNSEDIDPPDHSHGYNLRERRPNRHEDYVYNTVLNLSIQESIDKLGKEKTMESIKKELLQLMEKKVFRGLPAQEIQTLPRGTILPCKLFLKEKTNPDGTFDKLKSRLVAGGHRQDKNDYEEFNSPTVAVSSLFTIACIAAKEKRIVVAMDVPTAYPNARRKDGMKRVAIKLDKIITSILCTMDTNWRQYVLTDGTSVAELQGALYGLIESAYLWYDEISNFLESKGFKPNPIDNCIMNKMFGPNQCTIALYVDDIMVTCSDESAISYVENALSERYGKVSMHTGKVIPFLGMIFTFIDDKVKIATPKIVDELLAKFPITNFAETPAGGNLFEVDKNSSELDVEGKRLFHSVTATLLYIAKRTRPDILLPVNLMCTRVQSPSQKDYSTLLRIIKYLKGTKDDCLTLQADDNYLVTCYADASYGVHTDMKSHSGMVLTIGRGAIICKSSKQHIVTKSSTEAEVVAASDMAGDAIQLNHFLNHQNMSNDRPATLFQDNMSAILLLQNGKSSAKRTKHISIRYFWLQDRVVNGDIKIVYKSTEEMLADGLTKPLQGDQFKRFKNAILNIQ